MNLLRLTPDDWICWELWPKLEQRLKLYSHVVAPDTPVELLIINLRAAFVANNPLYCTLVLHDDEWRLHGHLLAWVETVWGQPHGLVHQVKCDLDVSHWQRPVIVELTNWFRRVNDLGCSPQVTHLRWITSRGDAWHRKLQQYPVVQEKTVLSLRMVPEVISEVA